MAANLDRMQLRRLWELALTEDGADRDVTSEVAVDQRTNATAALIARQPGVFAGRAIFELLKEAYPNRLTVIPEAADGEPVRRDMLLGTLTGSMRLLLSIERTLLNFLQRLSGVATLTRRYVQAAEGTEARIYDTRKTIPGWRQLDKYAVRCGGGKNHRAGLHDAILVKDNHLAGTEPRRLAAAAFALLNEAGSLQPPPAFVEFEVDTLDQFDELLKVVGIDVILLDNFTPELMREAVARRDAAGLKGKLQLEASGGITLESVPAIAATGVERIAVGALTHSATALDIGMDIEPLIRDY
jgi:nicotinate-nucleotide pyrophosphorylase (carboxylating)